MRLYDDSTPRRGSRWRRQHLWGVRARVCLAHKVATGSWPQAGGRR